MKGYWGESCSACESCNGHGVCSDGKEGDGNCVCEEGYNSEGRCGDCVSGRWGTKCQSKCPGENADCEYEERE